MHWYYGGMGTGWFGWLLMIIVLVVFVGGAILAGVIMTRRAQPPEHRKDSPEEVLAGRFARGEIDEEEYRKRRDVLRQ